MLVSTTGLASRAESVDKQLRPTPSAAPEPSSTEVLVTTQQVVFSTAAALGTRRENIGNRLVAFVRRMFATPTDVSRPRPGQYAKHYAFLEQALMAREMDRL
jgi:hypothetical protein